MEFLEQWRLLQAPQAILKIVKNFRIPFIARPPLTVPNLVLHPFQTPTSKAMDTTMAQLRDMGVLKPAPLSPSFVSQFFLAPKSDGSMRPIFNLKNLNHYVFVDKFRLINVHRIVNFLQPGDWLAKINLSNAYFHIPVSQAHRCFLRVIYRGQLWEMTCLPFGLACAPKIFASLTNWVAQILRQKGIRIVVYLDDYIIACQDPHLLKQQIQVTTTILEQLGWKINFDKSILIPQTNVQYLGIVWDTHTNRISLHLKRAKDLQVKIVSLIKRKTASLKEIQSIV